MLEIVEIIRPAAYKVVVLVKFASKYDDRVGLIELIRVVMLMSNILILKIISTGKRCCHGK